MEAKTYFSPDGNPEIWDKKPEGYFTEEEWEVLHPPYTPTPEEQEALLQKQYTAFIQQHLDETAYSYGYTGINEGVPGACNSVCTYENTGIAKFDDEGRAFKVWRSAVWAKGYEVLAEVQAGTRPIPTEREILDMLPKLEVIYTE